MWASKRERELLRADKSVSFVISKISFWYPSLIRIHLSSRASQKRRLRKTHIIWNERYIYSRNREPRKPQEKKALLVTKSWISFILLAFRPSYRIRAKIHVPDWITWKIHFQCLLPIYIAAIFHSPLLIDASTARKTTFNGTAYMLRSAPFLIRAIAGITEKVISLYGTHCS